jgi:hypothetical protein
MAFADAVIQPVEDGHRFAIRLAGPSDDTTLVNLGGITVLADAAHPISVSGVSSEAAVDLTLTGGVLLRLPPQVLRLAHSSASNGAAFVDLAFRPELRLRWHLGEQPSFDLRMPEGITLPPSRITGTDFVISAVGVRASLDPDRTLPQIMDAGFGEGFIGLYADAADLQLPRWLDLALPSTLGVRRCAIGNAGVTGKVEATFSNSLVPAADGQPARFVGPGAGSLFGLSIGVQSLVVDIRANRFSGSSIGGGVLLPFIEGPVDFQGGLGDAGTTLAVSLSRTVPLTLTAPGASLTAQTLTARGRSRRSCPASTAA